VREASNLRLGHGPTNFSPRQVGPLIEIDGYSVVDTEGHINVGRVRRDDRGYGYSRGTEIALETGASSPRRRACRGDVPQFSLLPNRDVEIANCGRARARNVRNCDDKCLEVGPTPGVCGTHRDRGRQQLVDLRAGFRV
jgi:hypothetical protein